MFYLNPDAEPQKPRLFYTRLIVTLSFSEKGNLCAEARRSSPQNPSVSVMAIFPPTAGVYEGIANNPPRIDASSATRYAGIKEMAAIAEGGPTNRALCVAYIFIGDA
jgi:hypothetical protein